MTEQKVRDEDGKDGGALHRPVQGTATKERICPECQGAMVSRKSKFGPFYGCANYPKCKHIDKS